MSEKRLAALDLVRGTAILAMVVYHFSWDLSWFALVDWPVSSGPGWRSFAAAIAGSFLFIAGVSLSLAHAGGIRWRAFWRREAVLVLAAAGVSAATYFAFGDAFVRFGILHSIAVSSLVALAFVRLPALAAMAAAVVVATAPRWIEPSIFDGPIWFWTGLGHPGFDSVDHVPLIPWCGLTLTGVALGKLIARPAVHAVIARPRFDGAAGRLVQVLGRRSLPIYLLHQPLLYGLVWSLVALGLAPDRSVTRFTEACTLTCQQSGSDEALCRAACTCTVDRLQSDGDWEPLVASPYDPALRDRMNTAYTLCLADPGARATD